MRMMRKSCRRPRRPLRRLPQRLLPRPPRRPRLHDPTDRHGGMSGGEQLRTGSMEDPAGSGKMIGPLPGLRLAPAPMKLTVPCPSCYQISRSKHGTFSRTRACRSGPDDTSTSPRNSVNAAHRKHHSYLGEHFGSEEDEPGHGVELCGHGRAHEEGYAAWNGAAAGQADLAVRSGMAAPSQDEPITCLKCGQKGHRAAQPRSPKLLAKNLKAPLSCAMRTRFQEPSNPPLTMEAVSQGKYVLDCGATKSLGWVYALEQIMRLSQ